MDPFGRLKSILESETLLPAKEALVDVYLKSPTTDQEEQVKVVICAHHND
jgi:hypothetical protein